MENNTKSCLLLTSKLFDEYKDVIVSSVDQMQDGVFHTHSDVNLESYYTLIESFQSSLLFLVFKNNKCLGLIVISKKQNILQYSYYKNPRICNLSFINLHLFATYLAIRCAQRYKLALDVFTITHSSILYTSTLLWLKDKISKMHISTDYYVSTVRDVLDLDLEQYPTDRFTDTEIKEINEAVEQWNSFNDSC